MMNETDVVIDMKALLEGAEPAITNDCCIYMAPFVVRKANQDAYTPRVVSIGPYHHRTPHPQLIRMERHKLLFFKAFLQQIETTLETLIHYLKEIEPVIRRCYSETLQLTKEELVKVILVDSFFIFELFYRSYENSVHDDALLKPWLVCSLRLDLLLLENQLPYFVLEELFSRSFSRPTGVSQNLFRMYVFSYFKDLNTSKLKASDNITIRHFTDLIRLFHLKHPLERLPQRTQAMPKPIPSATQLMEAGLRFKVKSDAETYTECHYPEGQHLLDSDCLLDMTFKGRVLEISKLKVEDSTEILFRNMMALEQSLYPYESYITYYVTFMDLIINTGRDVDILVEQGVLDNWLGDSDSVAKLINNLGSGITLTNFSSEYVTLCEDLNKFCRNPLRKLIATLRRDYCNTPWKTAGTIVGFILLILSLIQSVCSLLQALQYNG